MPTTGLGGHAHLGPGAEFDLVRVMLSRLGPAAHGAGDDAAVVDVPPGERLVVTTDSSVEDVHFRRAWLSPREIAYRSAAAAVSDLAAMAATPLGMTVALTVPARWTPQVAELADGLAELASETGAQVIGGDLSRGDQLVLAITALGTVREPLTRAGARPGDVVWVTGRLGGPRRALRAWESGASPEPADRARFARPVPRWREARWIAARGARAAMDISDGVASDLTHIAAASDVRIVLHLDALPRVNGASADDAARSGEEYELILCADAALDAAAFAHEFGLPLTAVGAVESSEGAGGSVLAFLHGARVPLPQGHDHFGP